jgi:hypothetical protein
MSEAELAQIAAFLESPVGRTWVSSEASVDSAESEQGREHEAQIAIDARTRLCRQITCLPSDGAPAP